MHQKPTVLSPFFNFLISLPILPLFCYDKLIKEKKAKGYKESNSSNNNATSIISSNNNSDTGIRPQLLNEIPEEEGDIFGQKFEIPAFLRKIR
jgi:hypothetical protein